ncbi:kynureninase [Sporothrix schenckii ATCC 58251]|uniref:Kynureninase n=1 Tax=Sporothrix schenckii (strain ATCC 58251 / de Perez 2211183) TaxID=1391915 RepID=U7PRF5_SPOS1|nr:kynureninase [Sporothrix schenckii ATCC 58251]
MMTIAQLSTALRDDYTSVTFADNAHTLDYAEELDAHDFLSTFKDEFVRPTREMIRKAAPARTAKGKNTAEETGSNGHADKTETAPTAQLEEMAGAQADGKPPTRGLYDLVPGTKPCVKGEHLAMMYPTHTGSSHLAMYFCGNSLGLQPKAVRRYVEAYLDTWAAIGVQGHFHALARDPKEARDDDAQLEETPVALKPWQEMAAECSKQMARLVGASPQEVVTMNTLTVNLHLMMASFYKPTATRHKIIAEWKPFPSDSYALESQIVWHGLDVAKSLVELKPDDNLYISTDAILATIDEHAAETALLLLPGIQYYTGQLFDMPRITAHARSKGIVVGWDLAHAVGNVELQLHDWDVDFAVWCTYKYLNAGPGSIAGAFVHERHGRVDTTSSCEKSDGHGDGHGDGHVDVDFDVRTNAFTYRPRLAGWYGSDLGVRFNMAKTFQPTPGAQGFQLSNPSAVDLASLSGALSVFDKTSMRDLRTKSLVLTAYAEKLLNDILQDARDAAEAAEAMGAHDHAAFPADAAPPFRIITPANPAERGAQISILMRDDDFLDKWAAAMKRADIVMDMRKPNVIRIAPVPLYNTFVEVHHVVALLRHLLMSSS